MRTTGTDPWSSNSTSNSGWSRAFSTAAETPAESVSCDGRQRAAALDADFVRDLSFQVEMLRQVSEESKISFASTDSKGHPLSDADCCIM